MQNETHYYLLKGTVKVSDSKMPELKTYRQTMGSAVYEFRYKRDYNSWLSSLQPCEIDESELEKVNKYVKVTLPNLPIDITDIVVAGYIDKTVGWSSIKVPFLIFKQPTEKQSKEVYSDNPRYPLFKHLADEYSLLLLDSELDEIINISNEIFKNR